MMAKGNLRPQGYQKRKTSLSGFPAAITSYQLGKGFICTVDNVSPGAVIARATAPTREEAEQKAVADAQRRLSQTASRRDALKELRESVQRLESALRNSSEPPK